ncbi:MAG: hypothetical protein ACOC47_08570 [Alkalispirochaetaceae bacterium]
MAKVEEQAILDSVHRQLQQEPALSDPTKISLELEKRGSLFNRRRVLNLQGKISTEAERRRIVEAVEKGLGGEDVEIEDHLVIPLV